MPSFPISGPFGIVLMLLLGGLGAPFPEELVVIGAGVAAYPERHDLIVMILASWLGVMLGDLLMYSLGRFFGANVLRHPILSRHLSPEKLLRVENYLARRGPRFIMVLRFMTGLRAPAYFSAGAMRFSLLKFVLYDGLAATVSVPVLCIAGFTLRHQVTGLQRDFKQIGAVVLLAGVGALILYLAYRWWKGERGDVEPPKVEPPIDS
jgi:membrane protein DedA with SNARE-associated domain